jgi:gas vesicle protein GvpL/GvpF
VTEAVAPAATTLYVYGVVRAGVDATEGEGIADAEVCVVESGRLAALVSPLPSDGLRLRRRDLRAHLAVLERVFERTTLVPCRFGMVVEDEEALRTDFLDARAEELEAALARLDGRTQLNVRVDFDEDAVLREIVARDPEVAELRRRTQELGDAGHFARIRLGELVTQALDARRELAAAAILDALEPAAEDAVVEPVGELGVLKASFLVADPKAFDQVLDRLAHEHAPRLQFESIGPLPPTAFVPDVRG